MGADQDVASSEYSKSDGRSIVSMLGPFGAERGEDGRFTRLQVWSKVAVIFFFIAFGTVWFPSWLMEPNSLAVVRDLYSGLMSASTWTTVLGLIVSGVWFAVLAVALVGMRLAQKSRLI